MSSLSALQCCAPINSTISAAQAEALERVFQALADRHRVQILNLLHAADGGEVCVCDFEDALGLKQSRTSYHLRQLVDAGLITRQRRGTFSYYRLVPGALEQMSALLAGAPKARLSKPKPTSSRARNTRLARG